MTIILGIILTRQAVLSLLATYVDNVQDLCLVHVGLWHGKTAMHLSDPAVYRDA